jgi:hypothetical protein
MCPLARQEGITTLFMKPITTPETFMDTQRLKAAVEDLIAKVVGGNALDAFDRYYADDVTMQENEQSPRVGKAACRAFEESGQAGSVSAAIQAGAPKDRPMSAWGQRQTSGVSAVMSAYPSTADIGRTSLGVCQVPATDIPKKDRYMPSSEIHGDDQSGCASLSSSSARPNAGRYRPKFNSKSLGRP